MDFASLQTELEALPPEDQNRASAFLTALRLKREGLFNSGTSRLDNPNQRWIKWDDAKSELGIELSDEAG